MVTTKFVSIYDLPQHQEFLDRDLKITFGDAAHTLFTKDDIIREAERHSGFYELIAAVHGLPDDVYIDMEG